MKLNKKISFQFKGRLRIEQKLGVTYMHHLFVCPFCFFATCKAFLFVLSSFPIGNRRIGSWSSRELDHGGTSHIKERLHLGPCLDNVEFSIPYHAFDVLWRSIQLFYCTSCTSNAWQDGVTEVAVNNQGVRWVVKHHLLFLIHRNTIQGVYPPC